MTMLAKSHPVVGTSALRFHDKENNSNPVFTLSVRLSGSFASILSIKHTFITNTSTILALRVSPYDQRLLQRTLEQHSNLIGHALLIPTILIELSLASNMLFMQKIRHELSVVEKATGQHAWLQIPAADAPAHDSELSRLGHAAKIDVLVSYRRIEALSCFLELVKESARQFEEVIGKAFVGSSSRGPRDAYIQWVGDLEQLVKFRMVDLKYSERRADNQLTAVCARVAFHARRGTDHCRYTASSRNATTWSASPSPSSRRRSPKPQSAMAQR
jgi:hypothetical protein